MSTTNLIIKPEDYKFQTRLGKGSFGEGSKDDEESYLGRVTCYLSSCF